MPHRFHHPRARTASGVDAHALYNDISASPVTMQGTRCVMAYAALSGFSLSSRDVETAYLQASLRGQGGVETWTALPRSSWPEYWACKWKEPMVRLYRALYGHPESGNRWQRRCDEVLTSFEWEILPEWPSIYRHPSGAALAVYVDDFLLAATPDAEAQIWEQLSRTRLRSGNRRQSRFGLRLHCRAPSAAQMCPRPSVPR